MSTELGAALTAHYGKHLDDLKTPPKQLDTLAGQISAHYTPDTTDTGADHE